MKNPYAVLGAKKGDDKQELLQKYTELREKYSAERKLSGEAGNDGKRKLHELDEAWYEITKEIGEVEPEEKTTEEPKSGIGKGLKEIDDELNALGEKIRKSDVGKKVSEIGESLGKAADSFFSSLFGKK